VVILKPQTFCISQKKVATNVKGISASSQMSMDWLISKAALTKLIYCNR